MTATGPGIEDSLNGAVFCHYLATHHRNSCTRSVRVKAPAENMLNVVPFERRIRRSPGLQEPSLFS